MSHRPYSTTAAMRQPAKDFSPICNCWRVAGAGKSNPMQQRFEYKFVRLGEGLIGAKNSVEKQYQQAVHQHAAEGWRLVQIFAPSMGVYGCSKYYELVLERPASACSQT